MHTVQFQRWKVGYHYLRGQSGSGMVIFKDIELDGIERIDKGSHDVHMMCVDRGVFI